MSDKLNIEQLFTKGLEGAELSPSAESWKAIQKKVRWQQFLRFNPGRFNIYYAGVLLLVGAGLIMALTSKGDQADPGAPDESALPASPSEGISAENSGEQVVPDGDPYSEEDNQSRAKDTNVLKDTGADSVEADELGDSALSGKDLEADRENAFVVPVRNPEPETHLMDQPLSVANFTTSTQSGCAPLKVQFIDQSIHATSYHWDFGTGETSSEQSPMYEYKEAGRFMVTLTTENHGSQPTVSRMMIEVLAQPIADFQIEEGLSGIDNHVVLSLVNYSANATSFSWSLVDEDCTDCSDWSSMEHQPTLELKSITPDSRSVMLEVISEQGCIDTVIQDLPLVVQSSETRIKFATAFSPNPSGPGDGSFTPGSKRIDLFHPIYIEVPMEFHMRIFTRRGELVFETRDIYQGWDGYHKQMPATSDVYVWMADGKWSDGKSFSFHGDVTLVRGQYW